ncbi:type II toxin-antitoxin system HicB family antitoxin [uncultured Nostoc sp.]|uniref:type II toxin-antitoxin system HicB family antitoxin n=1 Tax=uncultured Nostoc sp. TaxID=340711 RepID=UPI0026113F50|nr:type II toxin-antitoxin system HicB family antitoxin [uncultured Nostoc sp.]
MENGVVGQGKTQEDTVKKITEAIESFQSVYESEPNTYKSPISIEELYEFLLIEEKAQDSDIYELRKVYA